MGEVVTLTFASSLTNLCELNSSFDSATLRIAYHGANRKGMYISKETFEQCIQTMYGCPVVCHYDRGTDSIGAHDMEVVRDEDGTLRLVNLTEPVGFVPPDAEYYWDTVTEADGTEHEYLYVNIILWKRQEAYRKIKQEGYVSQSMEITIKSCERKDGLLYINSFEFTAFALIVIEPCYESAACYFASEDFKTQLSEMMHELKETMSLDNLPFGRFDMHQNEISTGGGKAVLSKPELIEKYNIDVTKIDFSIDDLSVEELEAKFQAMTEQGNQEPETPEETGETFSLSHNVIEEVERELSSVKFTDRWGDEVPKYSYMDCDLDAMEVYGFDREEGWILVGFSFKKDGDKITIDFDSRKRKKIAVVDFEGDDETQAVPFGEAFSAVEQALAESKESMSELQGRFDNMSSENERLQAEVATLSEFKASVEKETVENEQKEKLNNVFSQFEDLADVEAFTALRAECDEDCMKFSAEDVEEKCFAIRGRRGIPATFSAPQQGTPKIPVDRTDVETGRQSLPYNGIFEEYGISLTE